MNLIKKISGFLKNNMEKQTQQLSSHQKLSDAAPLINHVAKPFFDPDTILNIASDSFQNLSPKHISRSVLRECLKDDEVCSAIDTRLKKTTRCQWFLTSDNESDKEFIREKISDHIERIINCGWQSILFGYSIAEIIYQIDENKKIGIKKIIELPFEWFKFDPEGRLLFEKDGHFFDVSQDEFQYKFIAPVNCPSKTNPYGEALLENVYESVNYRKHGRSFWARWLEKYAMPFLVLKSQGGDFGKLMGYLKNAMRGSAMVLNNTEELGKIETGNNGEAFKTFVEHQNTSIQKVILGQINVTETGRALSEEAFRIAAEELAAKRDADMKHIALYIQQVIDYLRELNNITSPIIFSFDIESGLGKDRAERDAKLVAANVLQLTDKYIKRAYDFEEGDFLIPMQPVEQASNPQAPSSTFSHHFHTEFNSGDNTVNNLIQSQAELDKSIQAEKVFNFLEEDQLKEIIFKAKNEQELMESLLKLIENTDISKSQMLDLFEKTAFAARLFGFEVASKTIFTK